MVSLVPQLQKKTNEKTEKSGELKVVTKETTEFAKANLSETIAKVKAKVEKFDKKEFEEKVMKNVVAPVVKSVRAAQGGGNAELAQRRAKMDAENAKRLSDESKSDDASAAKKKIAAKAAVRAAKSASKAVILEAEAITSRMSECESKELELKAAELSERLAQLQSECHPHRYCRRAALWAQSRISSSTHHKASVPGL